MTTRKTTTDLHWSERAASVADDFEVNLMDVFQREMEYDLICRYLEPHMRVLEVGCGNGYSTDRFRPLVTHIDAFDYSAEMIARAKSSFGETNNHFIHDDVLAPEQLQGPYDTILCVRVLINLRDLDEQRRAVANMAELLPAGGLLVLAEGFIDGFERLTALREAVGLTALEPAAINTYCSVEELQPTLDEYFEVADEFHLGAYDYLTRVLYPLLAGPDNVSHNTVISEQCSLLARAWNPDCFQPLSRMRGLALRRSP